jgi:hypothetical protein
MKKTLAFLLLVLAPGSAAAETVWVGNSFLTSTTAACGSNIQVNDYARVLFRPAGADLGNGGDSYFAYLSQRSSYGMSVPGNSFQFGVNYGGQAVSSRLSLTNKAGGITQWVMNPAVPTTGTLSITLTASITNFFAIKDCTVTLVSAMQQLPPG